MFYGGTKMKFKMSLILCLLALSATVGIAQSADGPETRTFEKEVIVNGPGAPDEDMMGPGPGSFMFFQSEFGGEDTVVKGVPYSAEAVTERTQTLEDGNRIDQKNS